MCFASFKRNKKNTKDKNREFSCQSRLYCQIGSMYGTCRELKLQFSQTLVQSKKYTKVNRTSAGK